MISFCTWIHNRFHQFCRTLPINLAIADSDCEFCILDFGSSDGLPEWIGSINDSRVRYMRVAFSRDDFHFAKLYNAAHRMGRGDILVTLDCDNVIGPQFCDAARQHATADSFMWAWDGDHHSGTCGRFAFDRKVFWLLGGYDEQLEPIGYQDLDLGARARAAGFDRHWIKRPEVIGLALPNSRDDTCRPLGLRSYQVMNATNYHRSQRNIAEGRLIANEERK